MLRVPILKFFPGVGVALPTKVLERVRGRNTAESAARFEIGLYRESFQQTAAEGVADARGIDDAMGRHGGH
jgi:hypothetical protein